MFTRCVRVSASDLKHLKATTVLTKNEFNTLTEVMIVICVIGDAFVKEKGKILKTLHLVGLKSVKINK